MVSVPPEVENNLVMANAQLTQKVVGLCQKFDQMGQKQDMVWSRPVPTMEKFSGRFRRTSELDDWVWDATEKIRQVGLQGVEGVTYLCGFLEGPVLSWVHSNEVHGLLSV